ncbi:MAG TPA: SMC family ATPase [Marmoricola sp.]
MRLHRLEMTAFGPFAETVVVDFDRLSDASVFLLCGDTGAGKTTVLDGVCFALYGDVPSARGSARQLRSHHAADGVAPRVVLELTLGQRRLRFTRSPAWQRPKKRGSGTTTEQARVLVEEHEGGRWTLRTNRLDEAGHLVGTALGMTLAQFSQVVLLPQGQFDTFLRSSSEDRQKVLTRLFQTERFEQVERWFAERRKELWRATRRHNTLVAGVLHRLSEVSGQPQPESWDTEDLTAVVDDGRLRTWASELLGSAERRRDQAATALAEAATAREAASRTLTEVQRQHELHRRRAAALAERATLGAEAEQADEDRRRLAAARAAAPVAPLAEVADAAAGAAERAHERARAAVVAAAAALQRDAAAVRADDLGAQEQAAHERLAAARAFLPRAAELRESEQARAQVHTRCDLLAEQVAGARARLEALPEQRDAVAAELAGCRDRAGRLTAHQTALQALEERRTAARRCETLAEELSRARSEEATQAAAAQAARERWLELRERRLDGIAAELAAAMVAGEHCPVCGSLDHPALARPASDAPTRADEQAALRASEDAQVALEAHRDRVRGLRARLETAQAQVGEHSPDALAREADRLGAEAAAAEAAAAELPDLERALTCLDDELRTLATRLAGDEASLTAARDQLADLTAAVDRLSAELAELLTGGHERLEDVIAGHERLRDLLRGAREALAEEHGCAEHAEQASTRLADAAREAGFADAAAARRARLDPAETALLEARVHDRGRREQEVAAVLTDPEIAALTDQPTPAVDGFVEARDRADRTHTGAAGALQVAEDSLTRLVARLAELDEALAAWAPLREEYSRVRALADLVDGKGSDNTRQMRLSAYVLASRLGQVVAAANERLVRMSDGRYLLEHTDVRGVGDRRGGLSLAIADQWTDERRDPVTLSGGETFVVSLALALGLADVVTAESGGTRIDTLFVDEGFGSLDADTLEQVMDTLDQLREGGRVVGVVSHVTEMRHRIPTQLRVVKGRRGSHLHQTA